MIYFSKSKYLLQFNILQKSRISKINIKLIIFVLLLNFLGKTSKAQCTPTFTTAFPEIAVCDVPFDMTSYVSPAPASPGCSFVGTTVPVSSLVYFDPGLSGAGTFNIEYHPASGCFTPYVNQSITVVNTNVLTLLTNGNSVTKAVLSGTLACSLTVAHSSLYTNFRWYKNGFNTGITTSYFVTNDMGTYTVKADGCTNDLQDEVEIACNCSFGGVSVIGSSGNTTNLTSTPYTGGGGVGSSNSNIDFVLKGTIVIPENVVVSFTNANIRMEACAQIILQKGSSLGNDGGQLIITNSTFTGCDKWAGIIVEGYGNSLNNTFDEHGLFNATSSGCEISDAYKAVYAEEGGRVHLNGVDFENNENDLTMMNYSPDYSPTLLNLDFKGKWMHNDISSICGGTPSGYATINGTGDKKMIYLEDVHEFNLETCTFTGNDFLNGSPNTYTNGVELFNMTDINMDDFYFNDYFKTGIYGSYVDNTISGPPYSATYSLNTNYLFNNYYFDGTFDKGIYFEFSNYITLGYFTGASSHQNQFLGNYDYGTHIYSSSHILQFGNLFNTTTYSTSPTTGAGGNFNHGVLYNNVYWCYLQNCIFKEVPLSAELFDCTTAFVVESNFLKSDEAVGMFGVNNPDLNTIADNRFVDCDYGIVIGPDDNPISTSNNTTNTVLWTNIVCNYFNNNGVCIIGAGSIIDQGSNSLSNGNKFDNNNYWDILWDNSFTGNTQFVYYFDDLITPQSLEDMNKPNESSSLSYPNITVNGVSPGTADFTNTGVNSISVGTCFSGLSTPGGYSGIPKKVSISTNTINNPISNELILRGPKLQLKDIICYDALGKSHNLSIISYSEGLCRFSAEGLAAGMYFITINNQNLKFIKL